MMNLKERADKLGFTITSWMGEAQVMRAFSKEGKITFVAFGLREAHDFLLIQEGRKPS